MFEGNLEGFDNSTNVVISNCIERILKLKQQEEFEEFSIGIHLIRGTNVVCVGEIEETEKINWSEMIGNPLKGTKNPL